MTAPLTLSSPRLDLMQAPFVGRFLRWRWSRLVGQLLLLAVALLLLFDGFTGPRLAATNLATVVTWVHYRGLLMLALLLAGNLFCMNCPFTLPRTVARRLSGNGRRWPRVLRHKWLAIALLVAYFWIYEWLDLWASPLLTAWVIVAYFLTAFVLEILFAGSPFCKYVCPLGTFNFVNSSVSPLQIGVQEAEVCRTCAGNECVNGNGDVLGCGTALFAPQITSNLDCVFCLDCARACPHDNVNLTVRHPLREVGHAAAWPQRWDLNVLVLVFAFTSVSNAFGMVPPIYQLEAWLMTVLPTRSEGLVLALIFGVLNVLLPVGLGLVVAWGSRRWARRQESLRVTLSRYTPALLPLTFAIWFAHYAGFHFLSGALTILPVMGNFLLDVGIPWFGAPNWALGPLLPVAWLDPLELIILLAGVAASFHVLGMRARAAGDKMNAQLPWVLLILALAAAAIVIMYLPMEMRGTSFG